MAEEQKITKTTPGTESSEEKITETVPEEVVKVDISKMIADGFKGIKEEIKKTNKRLDANDKKIERIVTGKDDRFKSEAKAEDIKAAEKGREGVDERVVKIVNEVLGEDFGIELNAKPNGPGMNFVIIVPNRLSLIPMSQRPIAKKDGTYKKDANDKTMYEQYKPQDRRSRAVATSDNFDAIRKHCNIVLSNIVATYTKLKKPLPAFKTIQYGI